jgi:hypothetical protein
LKKIRRARPAKTPAELLERKIRGWQSKRDGEALERLLEFAAKGEGHSIIRIPDGCKQIGRGRLVRVKSPFDYILASNSRCTFFDAKHTSEKFLYLSSIASHQIEAMEKLMRSPNVRTGFIVLFSESKRIEFFDLKIHRHMNSNAFREGQGFLIGMLNSKISFLGAL